jgi:L-alanine-DL-glutamate epimerase-like enolase superfamily enzyme
MKITKYNCIFEREPLIAPFGFKGGYGTEIWLNAAAFESEKGNRGLSNCVQSPLWSDSYVFLNNTQTAAQTMMFLVSSFASKMAINSSWETPFELLDYLLPLTYDYAKKVTDNEKLRLTFALNALVAVDNAAWMLYCKENEINSFEQMVPGEFKEALPCKHDKIACIPLITYGISISEVIKMVDDGFFFLKIKIGADPDKDGDQDKMLEWDKKRLTEIHDAIKNRTTPYTESGVIPYYLDANGRYDSKERLKELLNHADKIGALERILIIEEPFDEEYKIDVSDLPVRVAADESAHSDTDVVERMNLGYRAIALKPIAKTMSMSLKIAKIAHDNNIPCFCADLTVPPILIDWNKNVAARLEPLPGMKIGVLESNGHQNYLNWEKLQKQHPYYGASWTELKDGIFYTNDDFYQKSGGILQPSEHYKELLYQELRV